MTDLYIVAGAFVAVCAIAAAEGFTIVGFLFAAATENAVEARELTAEPEEAAA